jgi:hypothetical protein
VYLVATDNLLGPRSPGVPDRVPLVGKGAASAWRKLLWGQHKVLIPLEERQLLAQAVVALPCWRPAPPDRSAPLMQAQIAPLDTRRPELPTAGGAAGARRLPCAHDHAMAPPHQAAPSHRFDHLRIE